VNCKAWSERLLVVEGTDDCHAISHLAAQHGLESSFGIWQGEGDRGAIDGFAGFLAKSQKRPSVLGIVLDCDASEDGQQAASERRWAQIAATLASYPYELPSGPRKAGTILADIEGYPRIGVWLMPDNESEGMLEDFLLQLAPLAAVAFAKECAKSARLQAFGNYKTAHESKAVAHTYLAWQDEPGKPLGIAIKARQFDSSNPFADHFIQWLRDMFQPSSLEAEEQAAQA
jgi:hypothetical protein